jgi:amino acid transporter
MSAAEPSAAPPTQYPQELHRTLSVLGNVGITLSGITPAASLYVIAAVAYREQGSGAVLSLLLAAVIGLGIAPCFAELGAAMPVAGSYYIVARSIGRAVAFPQLAVYVLLTPMMTATLALGSGEYLTALVPGIPERLTAVAIVVVATVVATLTIHVNALVTGLFLAVELACVTIIAVLGFTHVHQPLAVLLTPQIFTSHGSVPASVGVILAGVVTGLFAYNGFQFPINYSEETKGPRHGIGLAVLWAFAISVATQVIPFTGGLLGAPSLTALAASPAPMSYLVATLGGETLNAIVTVGLVLAILNAVIACTLGAARFLFCTARDGLWPAPVNAHLAAVHSRFRSPWIATLWVGGLSAALCMVSNVMALVTLSGVYLAAEYGIFAVAALASRRTQPALARPWRMPLWPLPPLLALVGVALVLAQQSLSDLLIVGVLYAAAGLYYGLYLHRQRDAKWLLREPAGSAEAVPVTVPVE